MIYTKQEWYTPAEVAVHNTLKDCWVSLHGNVLNITQLLEKLFRTCKCIKTCSCSNKNWYCTDDCVEKCPCFKRGFPYCDAKRMAMKLKAHAGKDISHWFNGDEWVKHSHPVTGLTTTYQPHGHGPKSPVVPSTRWRPVENPWWLDDSLVVGKVTARTRPIRITNALTSSTVTLEVCSEETVYQIMMRYLPHNSHFHGYTCRYLGRPVCMNRTLEENGVPDDRDEFNDLGLPENLHIPNLLMCYNDDLTEDPQRADCFCGDFSCLTSAEIRCENKKTENM